MTFANYVVYFSIGSVPSNQNIQQGAVLTINKVIPLLPEYPADFNEWWQATQAHKYTQVVGALENAFKNVAFEGWVGWKFKGPEKVV